MSVETRTPAEIEQDIERERAGLTHALDDLQNRFSADRFVHDIGEQAREYGGDISRSVARAVRDNPLALTLTGVGLAWLILGKGADRNGRSTSLDHPRGLDGRHLASRHARTFGTSDVRPGNRADETGPEWARSDWEWDELDDDASMSDRLRSGARDTKNRITQSGRAAGESVREGIDSAAGTVRDGYSRTADRAHTLAGSARDRLDRLRAQLSEGTEDLSEEARKRIVNARERAILARRAAIRDMRRGANAAGDFFEEHPLVAGALAMAAGAAAGGALPRSDVEDRAMGRHSDSLFNEAEQIFRQEVDKARSVAAAAADEARTIASEKTSEAKSAVPTASDVADAAKDEARSAGERIAARAKDEAEKQHLGDTKV